MNSFINTEKELRNISLPKENKKSKNDENQEENKNQKNTHYNYLDNNYNNELNIINKDDILQFDNLQDAFDVRNELEDYISEKYTEIEKKCINNKLKDTQHINN